MSVHCQRHFDKLKCSWCWIASSYIMLRLHVCANVMERPLLCRRFIANRMCNTTVTGSCCICYLQIWHGLVIFPVIGPSVLSAANQNAWVMTQ